MDRRMAAGRPASADTHVTGMINIADKYSPTANCGRVLYLRMTSEAQVGITHGEHFRVDGTVRVVAARATFAQRGVLVNKWQGLFAMALSAGFI